MTNLFEQKNKANALRKNGDFEEALIIYRDLWNENGDKFDGAGLLHCLRKLELFDEAIILADELINKYPDFNWCRIEVIWTYISGKLNRLPDNESLVKVEEIAQKILDFVPEGLAAKMVVFKVLKSAKASNDWNTINEWVVKLNPNSLSAEPMIDGSGKKGWSDQALWYNYRIKGLIHEGDPNKAIALVDEISDHFPKQRKFFLRLKASAYVLLNNLSEAERIYQNLCSGYKPDWWLLHEYSKVVRDIGRKEDALKLMYQAANSNKKLEVMVSLFEDIGMLCKEIGMNEEARVHLILCKKVRYENEWSVSESILDYINDLNEIIENNNEPNSIKETLSICKNYWKDLLAEEKVFKNRYEDDRKIRKGLKGEISLGKIDQPFCFILTENSESIFCLKSDLSYKIEDGDTVSFNAVPSFDKKKNTKSWKASNVRKC